MYTNLLTLLLAVPALAAPAVPFQNIGALVNSARIALAPTATGLSSSHSSSGATAIEFDKCPSVGDVSNVTISPCQGGNGTMDSPCEFHFSQ